MSRSNVRRATQWKTITAVAASALFLVAVAPLAGADPGSTPTKANVVSGSTPPSVDCTWAMPSMDKNNANAMSYYDPITGNSDDDAMTNPTPPSPCAIPGDGQWPTQSANARHMIQVRPNALNDPSPRRIELWSAVSADVGLGSISSVYWKVFHPDGTFKAQIRGDVDQRRVPGLRTACTQTPARRSLPPCPGSVTATARSRHTRMPATCSRAHRPASPPSSTATTRSRPAPSILPTPTA